MNDQTPIPTDIPGVSIIRLPHIVSTDEWYEKKRKKRWEDHLRESKKIMDGKIKNINNENKH